MERRLSLSPLAPPEHTNNPGWAVSAAQTDLVCQENCPHDRCTGQGQGCEELWRVLGMNHMHENPYILIRACGILGRSAYRKGQSFASVTRFGAAEGAVVAVAMTVATALVSWR